MKQCSVRLRGPGASGEKQLQVNLFSMQAARTNKSNYRQKTVGNGRSQIFLSIESGQGEEAKINKLTSSFNLQDLSEIDYTSIVYQYSIHILC